MTAQEKKARKTYNECPRKRRCELCMRMHTRRHWYSFWTPPEYCSLTDEPVSGLRGYCGCYWRRDPVLRGGVTLEADTVTAEKMPEVQV